MLKDPILHPRFTYGDYRQWMGDERWELIDGEAYLMSPAPKRRHQRASMGLSAQIANALEGGSCQVYAAPFDVRLPDGDEADDDVATVVQPDVVVICDPAKLDDAGCRGAPDWVVEILSPSTTARDRIDKRDLYQRHGVDEYWVLDPETAELTAFGRSPGSATFDRIRSGPAREVRGPELLPDLTLDWDRILEV